MHPTCGWPWETPARRVGLALGILFTALSPARAAPERPPLPYRFLLVVNDQWKDPASEVIEGANEFSMLCALLRSWGLPFDIYRLDQQRFDAYHLLDRTGRPRHGTIIWNAPGARLADDGAGLLRTLVREAGVGLVALSDAVATPIIAELVGAGHEGKYQSAETPASVGEHFITRDVQPQSAAPVNLSKLLRKRPASPPGLVGGTQVRMVDATVVSRRGEYPFLTARQAGAGRVVWLDAERSTAQIFRQHLRDLFKRALVWVNGYALYAEYPRSVILFMDDMGASDKTYYPGWHYPSLSEATIRSGLIEPLQRHRAVMVQNVNTGFVDRKTRRVLNPWAQQRVVDELDVAIVHDYASTKRGLDAGVKAGVFEIQSHGWTHMSPDLDSPPGPFWSAAPRSALVQQNWYKEFGDVVRKIEIPAAVQRIHLQRSLDCLREDFGIRAISLRCGGSQSSLSPPNNTMRLAAKMGFGLGQAEAIYCLNRAVCLPLDPISPVLGWQYAERLPAAEMPWTIDAPCWIGSHDRDVAMDGQSYARLLDDLGDGVRYLTNAEYSAYLHAAVDRDITAADGLALRVHYDVQSCAFFLQHPSAWILHLSDETRAVLKSPALERRRIEIRPGLGSHVITP